MADFKPTNLKLQDNSIDSMDTRLKIDSYLRNFKGGSKVQRGSGWELSGSGNTFLASTVSYSIIPDIDGLYTLGSTSYKWADVQSYLINGVTPKPGTATYYVASESGGDVTTAISFTNGILT